MVIYMNRVLRDKKALALFVLPAFIIFTGFVIIPVTVSLYYSFFSGSPGLNWEFAGFKNYIALFKDKNFISALWVNIRYVVVVMTGQVGLGLLLALMFKFWLKRGKSFVRTLVFFPVVLPTVAVGQLFAKIYEIQPYYGLLNSFLSAVGLDNLVQPWIGQASTSLWSLCVMDIWTSMGFYSVIFFGGLLNISDDVIEAARIDGCNAWNLFKSILLPMLRPILITALVFSFSGTVKMYESALALTKGGPGSATKSLAMYMYDTSFTYGKVGYGSVIAISIFFICVVGSMVINKFDIEDF